MDDFTDLEAAAWGGLVAVFGRLNRDIDADLIANSGITHPEFEVLLRLLWEPDHRLRYQGLAAASLLTPSGMSRVVSRLQRAGLVRRVGATEDLRGAYAELTDAGHERILSARHHHVGFVREHFLSAFADKELTQMARLWRRLADTYPATGGGR